MKCLECKGNQGVCNCKNIFKKGDVVELNAVKCCETNGMLFYGKNYIVEHVFNKEGIIILIFKNCDCIYYAGGKCKGHFFNPHNYFRQFKKVT